MSVCVRARTITKVTHKHTRHIHDDATAKRALLHNTHRRCFDDFLNDVGGAPIMWKELRELCTRTRGSRWLTKRGVGGQPGGSWLGCRWYNVFGNVHHNQCTKRVRTCERAWFLRGARREWRGERGEGEENSWATPTDSCYVKSAKVRSALRYTLWSTAGGVWYCASTLRVRVRASVEGFTITTYKSRKNRIMFSKILQAKAVELWNSTSLS